MKPTHHHDTKAYHDYYIHQAGKGYPVFADCIGSSTRVIISPSLPSTGTILNNGTWASLTILGSTKGQYTHREFNPLLKNKFHMVFNEINHKIDMKVKINCQVIISPLL
jgi:hypothetical protein